MFRQTQCPTCGENDTKRVDTVWNGDLVEEIRVCNNCTVQFTNNYGDPFKEVEYTMAVNAIVSGPTASMDDLEEAFHEVERVDADQVAIQLDDVTELYDYIQQNELTVGNIKVEA